MNQEETLALHARGPDAWNTWAEEMLAERKALDGAEETSDAPERTARAEIWVEAARADFSNHAFEQHVEFGGYSFPGTADFSKATFANTADFRATFADYADFNRSTFEVDAMFIGIEAEAIFSLGGAVFRVVPEFAQARFKEAPRLDATHIAPRGFWAQVKRLVKGGSKEDPEEPGRWRVLQKLANDGHDHAREQYFFRGELLAKRGLEGRLLSFAYWAGIAYQGLSNFGSSLFLPVPWWGLGVFGFAWFYLTEHLIRATIAATLEAPWNAVTIAAPWREAARRVVDWGAGPADPFACVAGAGHPLAAAFGLSLRKSLFAGFGSPRAIDQIHVCLFGAHPASVFGGAFQPVIPYWVSGVGVVQFLFSAILVFLFGLALRNHFKIR